MSEASDERKIKVCGCIGVTDTRVRYEHSSSPSSVLSEHLVLRRMIEVSTQPHFYTCGVLTYTPYEGP